ncbi:homoserine kinase [Paenibacillus allorhizosphaerae]|uniref:Homoserine kinase n=1 Tax=Paenibacillus allorhizosphaerae TaxID=2849866 RepID=A0ABN7TTL1_9BACL|nr:homoserine kinase [Paenibacillus allorhizosphaerae]CAG7655278.1 Homoserine kinase [Paenibacillus allorhizosphaerae]
MEENRNRISKVRVKVPASTANLGPGFDTLGMALDLYAWIEMGVADQTRITLHGDQMNGVPTDKSNLIYEVAQMVFKRAGVSLPELDIAMYSDIPLTRGLGSSASAIVGGLAAANALIGSPLSDDTLFQMATELEHHPDNVGASLFGGLVVAFWDGTRAEHIRVEPDPQLEVLVAIPHFQLATEKARGVLPRQQSLENAVFNVGHSSLLVAAFCTGRLDMISRAMKDALHQPYRAPLVPGLGHILAEATEHGALGVALSGAGPTMLALVDRASSRKAELENFMIGTLRQEGIEATMMWLSPDRQGVQIEAWTAGDEPKAPLMEMIKGDVRA